MDRDHTASPDVPTPAAGTPPETWTAVALRDPDGYFLARIAHRPTRAASAFFAQTWADPAEMDAWLSHRAAGYRRRVHEEGWEPVELACAAEALPRRLAAEEPAHAGTRPMVAEACTDA